MEITLKVKEQSGDGFPEGARKLLQVQEGKFGGPQLSGVFAEGNSIQICRRSDEVGKIKFDFMMKIEGGADLWMFGEGSFFANAKVRENIRATKTYPNANLFYMRACGRLETNSKEFVHLNHMLFLAYGSRPSLDTIILQIGLIL